MKVRHKPTDSPDLKIGLVFMVPTPQALECRMLFASFFIYVLDMPEFFIEGFLCTAFLKILLE